MIPVVSNPPGCSVVHTEEGIALLLRPEVRIRVSGWWCLATVVDATFDSERCELTLTAELLVTASGIAERAQLFDGLASLLKELEPQNVRPGDRLRVSFYRHYNALGAPVSGV